MEREYLELQGPEMARLTHHVHILEMNGESYRLKHSRQADLAPLNDDGQDVL